MSGLIIKFILLLLYVILLSIVVRLCELIVWCEPGFMSSQLINPVSLSVHKLKSLLDVRGVNYEGVVEKKELSQLVAQSGDVLEGEPIDNEEDDVEDDTTQFYSKGHFYEEVEDKKDSVWVIQVRPPFHQDLLSEKSWKTIRKKLAHFGIRTGTFDCDLDPVFCARKKWYKSSILLAMPEGETYKDHVTMYHYYKTGRPSNLIDWINARLRSKVTSFTNQHNAEEWMEIAKTRPNHFPIRVAYFSEARNPPLFYTSLSVKYTGRIKFAFTSGYEMEFNTRKHSSEVTIKYPSILIATSEGDLSYGKHAGEYISYDRLVIYLKTLSPDANDAFIWSLSFLNILCVFDFFITQGGILKRVCYFLWTVVKANFTFLAFWLPILGMLQLSILEPFWNYTNKTLRRFLISNFMCYMRSDLLIYSSNPKFLLVTFLMYCCIIGMIEKYRKRLTPQESNTEWLQGVLHDVYAFLVRPSTTIRPRPQLNRAQMEEGWDMLIQRLAVPGIWLRPVIPMDYISRLPTWKYENPNQEDESMSHQSCEPKFKDSNNGTWGCKKLSDDDCLGNQNVSRNEGVSTSSTRLNDAASGDDQLNLHSDDNISFPPEHHGLQSQNDDTESTCPNNNVESKECAICLDTYQQGIVVCGLPCGHSYHHSCISRWLRGGNHCCPSCRWPAYKTKASKLL